jgi:glycine betaine/proline transport system ATP-binding protein
LRSVPDDRERSRQLSDLVQLIRLEGFENHYPHQLSGGMRQRVELARAMAGASDVLLMDEPFSALDPLIRRDMQDLLVELQAQDQRTTVFVTHDLNEAMRIGDRVMVMREGRVVQLAPGPEIVAHPADDYVSEFVSDVDRARVLSAADLIRPARLVLPEDITPHDALRRLGENEVTGAFVTGADDRLLGVVTDDRLVSLTRRGAKSVHGALGEDYHQVKEGDVIGDFMHLAGRQVVPVTVLDEDGRLRGVVPRGAILSALSTVNDTDETDETAEVAHA